MSIRLGIDFRAMQIGHQFRGIGEVVRQSSRQLDERLPADAVIVALHDAAGPPVEELLADAFPSGRTTRIVALPTPSHPRVAKLRDAVTPEWSELFRREVDLLLQFDFMLGVPASVPTITVMYDQVPLLLGDRYPWNYRPTFRGARRAGLPLRTSVYKAGTRRIYERHLALALERSTQVIAISEHTKATTEAFAAAHGVTGVGARTQVAHLGYRPPEVAPRALNAMEEARIHGLGLADTPFVFFLGGSDERRRIDLLVAAFNDVRARGRRLKLVLAGYDFVTMERVLSDAARTALLASSYKDDIHLLGFASDAERAWLYGNAAGFTFPSEHEGFGLPVVESLAAGCAVVAFDNTSISEVAGPNCILVPGSWEGLADGIDQLLARTDEAAATAAEDGRAWAATFTWDQIGEALTTAVVRVASASS